ncbi:hypothetical protein ASPZODRAFT_137417 [Penicilliopsis zonata CBS 506.65]|uniref:Uncharacterized protein n=1 Tax=Penicilliopsis zonata CBS 506.65 TaxID=1073090 RepID=A0A1L9S503_9EURO|nr:hypothetical protein ASPZODRAFT_137417 [Penicilliopsis zonata CBS 506.65]OJJ42230.1 hypothetical protein ASPZODRAFT_137417 [Penicilliopsis zonata CBS 506.65]
MANTPDARRKAQPVQSETADATPQFEPRRRPTEITERAVEPYKRIRSSQSSMAGPLTTSRAAGGGQLQGQPGWEDQEIEVSSKKEDTGLKLRLDLNLDVEVDLKASIHGDLTLSLLYVILALSIRSIL